jgi:hypothetical protein
VDSFNWQQALWSVPNAAGGWWTFTCSVVAFAAAVLMFIRTVLIERWNLLAFFRSLYIIGLLLIAVSALNSGWQRWTEPLFAISGIGMAMIYWFNLHRTKGSIVRHVLGLLANRVRRPFDRWTIA